MAVKNFREGTFAQVDKIGVQPSMKNWVRSFACYCCPLACKKSGKTTDSPFAGLVHDGPEYETGAMLGAEVRGIDVLADQGIRFCVAQVSTNQVVHERLVAGAVSVEAGLALGAMVNGEPVLRFAAKILGGEPMVRPFGGIVQAPVEAVDIQMDKRAA